VYIYDIYAELEIAIVTLHKIYHNRLMHRLLQTNILLWTRLFARRQNRQTGRQTNNILLF